VREKERFSTCVRFTALHFLNQRETQTQWYVGQRRTDLNQWTLDLEWTVGNHHDIAPVFA